jgi:hypothetical protein
MGYLETIPVRVWECLHTMGRHKHPSSISEVSIPVRVLGENIAVLLLPSSFNDSG